MRVDCRELIPTQNDVELGLQPQRSVWRTTDTMPTILVLLHAFVTLALVGLIWTIQVVHYPLFALVGTTEFQRYEREHATRMTWLVAPLMLLELGIAIALVVARPPKVAPWLTWSGLGLVALVWIITFGVSMPCHQRLSGGFDVAAHRRLVATNWLRTGAWTVRGFLAIAIVRATGC